MSGARSPSRHPGTCSGTVGPGEQPEELGGTQSLCPPRISNIRQVRSLVSALGVAPPDGGLVRPQRPAEGGAGGRLAHAGTAARLTSSPSSTLVPT